MTDVATSAPGSFCLIELASPDTTASLDFYKRLFGWDSAERKYGPDRHYWAFMQNGQDVAGLFFLSEHEREIGRPAAWNTRIACETVAQTAQHAQSLGGTILNGPSVAGQNAGEYARILDPLGATFELWRPLEQPCGRMGAGEGSVCWFELTTGDRAASISFYTELFGWETKEGFNHYTEFVNGGRAIAGVVSDDDADRAEPASWRPFVRVANADAAMTTATLLGATVVSPAKRIEGVGLAAVLRDPQGARLSIVEYI
jgi:predicted enzyme related to lactoylglutathione lyase